MARPKGKNNPIQEGKPTVEQLRQRIGEGTVEPLFPPAPSIEFIAAALSGILARPGGQHPFHMTREEKALVLKVAFDFAEEAEKEHERRYGA